MKIIVVASYAPSLVNFRLQLLCDMVDVGHDVIACAPEKDLQTIDTLRALGVRYVQVPMKRTGTNPLADLRTLCALARLYLREKPDLILAYTQKPIIYGGMAARITGHKRFIAMVTGLGFVFTEEGRGRMLRRFVSMLYRIGIRKAEAVIVFNRDDPEVMRRYGILTPRHKIVQVPGSGVDKARFDVRALPDGPPVFILVCRLMRDKGVLEYAEAARLVRAKHPDVKCQLLGPRDDNPASINDDELAAMTEDGAVDYLGATKDVAPYLANASVFVLPSYREGLPRSVLEAMSTGRAIITSDAPGCRESILDGDNGFIVPVKNPQALAQAMLKFVDDPSLIASMGRRSRQLVEEIYAVERVNARVLAVMGIERGDAVAKHEPARHVATWPSSLARRAIDIAAGAGGLIVLAPVMAVIAVLIGLTMGWPVFFTQSRVGRKGRPFRLIKFRSMTSERAPDGQLKPDADRVTRLGAVLRRFRLDELPELWNVLAGNMTLVGPRPLLPSSALTQGDAGQVRGAVRPGLTGWAQVNGNTLLSDEEKLALDLWYVENASPGLDLSILGRTLWVMLNGERINEPKLRSARESTVSRSG